MNKDFYEKKAFLENQIQDLTRDLKIKNDQLNYFQRELNFLVSNVKESVSNEQQLLKG